MTNTKYPGIKTHVSKLYCDRFSISISPYMRKRLGAMAKQTGITSQECAELLIRKGLVEKEMLDTNPQFDRDNNKDYTE